MADLIMAACWNFVNFYSAGFQVPIHAFLNLWFHRTTWLLYLPTGEYNFEQAPVLPGNLLLKMVSLASCIKRNIFKMDRLFLLLLFQWVADSMIFYNFMQLSRLANPVNDYNIFRILMQPIQDVFKKFKKRGSKKRGKKQ